MAKKKKNKNKGNRALQKKILGLFESYPKAELGISMMQNKLGAEKFDRQEIASAVQELWNRGKINKKGSKYLLNTFGKSTSSKVEPYIIEGKVDSTMSGAAYIITEEEEKDIFIPASKVGNALNGDIVKVSVKRKISKYGKLEGKIIEIVKRKQTQFAGIIRLSDNFAFLVPDQANVNMDFYIPKDLQKNSQDGEKVIVEVIKWPTGKNSPIAKVIQVLGQPGSNDVEMKSLLANNGFRLEFPNSVMKQVKKLSNDIDPEEIAKRRDMREITTLTIDPIDAKDFDDAISIAKLENGNWEIGIHIADVSHFVQEGSALDKEAFNRATSVYLVDRVLPMFPELLSNFICSLRPNEDKLCYSAVFELTEFGRVDKQWFGRTVIHSNRRFHYAEAQDIIDRNEGDFVEELQVLDKIAKEIRKERFKSGSINFASEEVKFKLDENAKPVSVYVKESLNTNKLIEEYMLLANRKVAHFVNNHQVNGKRVPFVNRIHDLPNTEKLMEFQQFAASFGYRLKLETPKQISDSINHLMKEIEGKPEEHVLSQLAIRTMSKAAYSTKNIGHYGLSFENYAHFTSPIRRYPDVMVHRIVTTVLDKSSDVNFNKHAIEEECKHCSEMERKAMTAERQSIKFKQVEFLEDKLGMTFSGVISGVAKFGFFVELEENKCEGLVHIDTLLDDVYFYDEKRHRMVGHNSGKKYQLGDPVKVIIKNTDIDRRTIDMTVVQ